MDFLDILNEKAFLGREFLVWLWYNTDRMDGTMKASSDGGSIEVSLLDRRMVLDLLGSADGGNVVTVKGGQSEMREAMAALREGKTPTEIGVWIRADDTDFSLTLKSEWFSFSGFKIPPVFGDPEKADDEQDREGMVLEKMYLIEKAVRACG